MTANWIEFKPQNLFPDEFLKVIETCQETAEDIAISIDALADVTRAVSYLTRDFIDAQTQIITATQELIDAVIQQLTQTGIYWIWHMPPSVNYLMPPQRFLMDLAYSLDDVMDENRPILPAEEHLGAVCIMATDSGFFELMRDFRGLAMLFGKFFAPDWQLKHHKVLGDPFEVFEGVGNAPDWGSAKLSEVVPIIHDLVSVLESFRSQVTGVAPNLLLTFSEFLDRKAKILNDIARKLAEIIKGIQSLLDFEGAWILPIYGSFNKVQLQRVLVNTKGGPIDTTKADFNYEAIVDEQVGKVVDNAETLEDNRSPQNSNATYTAGVMFLAMGLVDSGILFDFFNLAKEETEKIVEDISEVGKKSVELSETTVDWMQKDFEENQPEGGWGDQEDYKQ